MEKLQRQRTQPNQQGGGHVLYGFETKAVQKNMELLPRWYAIAVYARQEKAARDELLSLGYQAFLPTLHKKRIWSDRVKAVELALFPGYLFVNAVLDAEARFKIVRPKQVIDVVGKRMAGSHEVAQHVPDRVISSLQLVLQQSQNAEPTERLLKGVEVRVVQGPLRGAIGIVEKEPNGAQRLVVQVPLLGRGVRTELSVEDVVALEELVC